MRSPFPFFEAQTALVDALKDLNWESSLVQEHLPVKVPTARDRVYIDSTEDGDITRLTEQGGNLETHDIIVVIEAKRLGADPAPAWNGLRDLMRETAGVLDEDPELGGTVDDSLLRAVTYARCNPLPDNKGWIARAVVRIQIEARTN